MILKPNCSFEFVLRRERRKRKKKSNKGKKKKLSQEVMKKARTENVNLKRELYGLVKDQFYPPCC